MLDILVIVCLVLLFCTFIIYAWNEIKEIVIMRNEMKRCVDNSKMTRDICNGVSQSEIRRRYGNGYYDKNK